MREKERNLSKENIERIRKLRSEMSESEKLLWGYLEEKQRGWKFRRQHPIGPYALDFYCPKLKLCIEVDGEQHQYRQEADARRDVYLRKRGILTVRIPSLELWGENNMNVQSWAEMIDEICEARHQERS